MSLVRLVRNRDESLHFLVPNSSPGGVVGPGVPSCPPRSRGHPASAGIGRPRAQNVKVYGEPPHHASGRCARSAVGLAALPHFPRPGFLVRVGDWGAECGARVKTPRKMWQRHEIFGKLRICAHVPTRRLLPGRPARQPCTRELRAAPGLDFEPTPPSLDPTPRAAPPVRTSADVGP